MLATVLLLLPLTSHGGSATWNAAPGSGDWNTASNWTPVTVPNGSSDTATFSISSIVGVSISQNVDLADAVFSAGASAFTITASPNIFLQIEGTGISNSSANTQNFVTAVNGMGESGSITLRNSATAGSAAQFTNKGSMVFNVAGGRTSILNGANAGSASFINNGGTVDGAYGGTTFIFDTADAGTGSFTSNGGAVNGAYGGETFFYVSSSAANGTFTNNGGAVSGASGGRTWFFSDSTAANGTFNNNAAADADSGLVSFANNSSAANGIFTNNGGAADGNDGGGTFFNDDTTAANGTFINNAGAVSGANGGLTFFFGNATAAGGIFTNNVAVGASSGVTSFFQSSDAGNGIFSNHGGPEAFAFGGYTSFSDTANAGAGIFANEGGTAASAFGAHTTFNDNSSAMNATFNNDGATASDAFGGFAEFFQSATAGSATFNNNGAIVNGAIGGRTTFGDSSSASNSTLIATGGSNGGSGGGIYFFDDSTGGTSRVEVFGDAYLEISSHNPGSVTAGSIEGSGIVFLGANNLAIGGNNLSTSFSGFIDDGNLGGSISKTGSGTLTLEANAGNNYFADTVTLTIASASTMNLNFIGTPDTVRSLIVGSVPKMPGVYGSAASGAPNQLPQFTGSGELLVTTFAVSRKMQGANSYDINLPLAGPAGVECRSGGAGNNYQIVVTFVGNVTYSSVSVTSGTGAVSNVSGNNTSTLTIDLSGVTSPQKIVVTISSLNDGFATSDLAIPMRVLVGDVTGNGSVNSTDVSQTKLQSGQAVTASNYRQDVSANGTITATDVSLVKLHSGQSVSP